MIQGFHFYPVIIHGNTATIYPHNNLLDYQRTYLVQIDPGVLTVADGSFAGVSGDEGWTFTTKPTAPAPDATRVVVAADGTGDFNTVQGALDFVPDHPAQRITIFIRNGTYEEIVFFHDKANLTIRGEDRERVQIEYGNNSVFNGAPATPGAGPGPGGPSRRGAFTVANSTGIELTNFSVSNLIPGQAEGLTVAGEKNIVSHVNIKGSGDALNLRGSVYLTDCKIIGDGDTILGVGPAFFDHCELQLPRGLHVDPQHRGESWQRLRRLYVCDPDDLFPPGPAERPGDRPPAQQPRHQLSLRRGRADRLPPAGHSPAGLGADRRRHDSPAPLGIPQHEPGGRPAG